MTDIIKKSKLGGNSFFTSDFLITFYYVLGLLAYFNGLTGFIALIGALISGKIASKENALLACLHCKWISRTVWVSALLILAIVIACITFLALGGAGDIENIDYNKFINSDDFFKDPQMATMLYSCTVSFCLAGLVILWAVYRFIRGIINALRGNAPKPNYS